MLAALALGGCSDGANARDAGGGTDGGDPATGRVVVQLTADDQLEEEGAEVTVAAVGLARLRARNDRGGSFEPELEDVGRVDLLGEEPIVLEPAPPATYGRLRMRLEAAEWGPSFALEIVEPERTLAIELTEAVDGDAGCEVATVLPPGGELRLDAELDVEALYEAATGAELPAEGTVRITESSEPEAAERVAAALPSAFSLDCDAEATGESSGELMEQPEDEER